MIAKELHVDPDPAMRVRTVAGKDARRQPV